MANSIAIKGKYDDNGTVKTVTIATLSGIKIDPDGVGATTFPSIVERADDIIRSVQKCVSATVTGYTITYDANDSGNYGTPGDVLESAEIFSADFSDTEVVPTLQITNMNSAGTNKTFSFKYMADPVDTQYFDDYVTELARED